jgi:hypothetical protein
MGLILVGICVLLGIFTGVMLIAMHKIGRNWGRGHMAKHWGIDETPHEEHDDSEE